jgi:hypothetical protein
VAIRGVVLVRLALPLSQEELDTARTQIVAELQLEPGCFMPGGPLMLVEASGRHLLPPGGCWLDANVAWRYPEDSAARAEFNSVIGWLRRNWLGCEIWFGDSWGGEESLRVVPHVLS